MGPSDPDELVSARAVHGVPVLYFHGAASQRDEGPSDRVCDEAGVRILRHVRPGYDLAPTAPDADLRDVATTALDAVAKLGVGPLVVMGWSGGGPYALAAAALGRSEVRGVCLLGSWSTMDPPDPGLPRSVRTFMNVGRRVPRWALRRSLAAVGLHTPGHVGDVHRVARPWGFALSDVTTKVPVAAWHAKGDKEVPIAPWRGTPGVDLTEVSGEDHEPSAFVWRAALDKAALMHAEHTP
jgi:pimeloyl-ACP methyl ester carboxylesterase